MTQPPLNHACIALGSSIEPRAEHLRAAIEALDGALGPHGRVVAVSRWHETEAVVPPGQAPGAPYLNGACVIETEVSARQLLNACLEIERSRGRDRRVEGRWGARTLDLDLLLLNDEVIRDEGLEVPHPRMLERLFVLVPLAEVAPGWLVPGTDKTIAQHLDALRRSMNS
ncbi:MAG: 2-amino-4-hydroxy-6-hydroxymethyldihydropteridine diphosphokinase [Phycisphaeraceae bacterium]|nr:2-amino-4-hydroxy-6-hydroxymethyldihydropteridine diphosphokinase [Phycisphaeraceae bacterium]